MDVHDLREVQDSFTLKDKGIELHKLKVPSDLDWENEKEVSSLSTMSLPSVAVFANRASRICFQPYRIPDQMASLWS